MQQSRQQKGAIFTRKVPMDSLSSVLDGIVHFDLNIFPACTLHRMKLAHWLSVWQIWAKFSSVTNI